MRISKIAMAVAAVSVAGTAAALPTNASYDVELLVSGATAQSKQIEATFKSFCTSDVDKYVINDDSKSGYAVSCFSAAADNPYGADKNLLMRKEEGGSGTGVAPVIAGDTLTVVALDNTCVADGTDDDGNNQYACGATTKVASVGISDVEPALFVDSVPASVQAVPVNVSTFGVVVSPGLYTALQTAQGLDTADAHGVENMPTFPSDLVANIFAGKVTKWDTLVGQSGNPITLGAGLSNTNVNACLRKESSGTQQQFKANYMGIPCLGGGAAVLASDNTPKVNGSTPYIAGDLSAANGSSDDDYLPVKLFPNPAAPDNPNVPYIYSNSGSSDMGRCLTKVTAQDRWAIGFQSLEKVAETSSSKNNFKFVAVDGVVPTLEKVAAGLYKNWSSTSFQINTAVATADQQTLANGIISKLQVLADVVATNASFKNGINTPTITVGGFEADVGNLAIATLGSPANPQASAPFNPASPVMPYNKGITSLNTCSIPNIAGDVVDVTTR